MSAENGKDGRERTYNEIDDPEPRADDSYGCVREPCYIHDIEHVPAESQSARQLERMGTSGGHAEALDGDSRR
jgi:hypothetical protein